MITYYYLLVYAKNNNWTGCEKWHLANIIWVQRLCICVDVCVACVIDWMNDRYDEWEYGTMLNRRENISTSLQLPSACFLIISTITAIDADPIFIPIIHFTILYLSIMGYRWFSLKRIVRLSLSHHGKNASSPQHCSTNHQRVSRNLDSERFLIFLTKCTSFITTSCHSYRDELWVLM